MELVRQTGAERIARITGLAPHRMYSISKMMWIKTHDPEVYAKAAGIFLIEDYYVWLLTGNAQIDYGLATRTMAFDINTLTWSRDIFDAAGIDVSLMSRPVPTGTPAGRVTPEAAAKTGLWSKDKLCWNGLRMLLSRLLPYRKKKGRRRRYVSST